MNRFGMQEQMLSDRDWLKKQFRKSKSIRTQISAQSALSVFEYFCQYDTGIKNKHDAKMKVIAEYQKWYKQGDDGIQKICGHLLYSHETIT